ncbi:MAG: hypothetical protein JW981_10240 [Anaerolineae bacterium]|nr:hypothetical protein [Anaerolineae bacterium]
MKIINVKGEIDIVAARMEVRKLARSVGFNTQSQAQISLATSSLAHFLDMGGGYNGQIRFGYLNSSQFPQVKVICMVCCGEEIAAALQLGQKAIGKLRWMVDELYVESSSLSGNVEVTLIKYTA